MRDALNKLYARRLVYEDRFNQLLRAIFEQNIEKMITLISLILNDQELGYFLLSPDAHIDLSQDVPKVDTTVYLSHLYEFATLTSNDFAKYLFLMLRDGLDACNIQVIKKYILDKSNLFENTTTDNYSPNEVQKLVNLDLGNVDQTKLKFAIAAIMRLSLSQDNSYDDMLAVLRQCGFIFEQSGGIESIALTVFNNVQFALHKKIIEINNSNVTDNDNLVHKVRDEYLGVFYQAYCDMQEDISSKIRVILLIVQSDCYEILNYMLNADNNLMVELLHYAFIQKEKYSEEITLLIGLASGSVDMLALQLQVHEKQEIYTKLIAAGWSAYNLQLRFHLHYSHDQSFYENTDVHKAGAKITSNSRWVFYENVDTIGCHYLYILSAISHSKEYFNYINAWFANLKDSIIWVQEKNWWGVAKLLQQVNVSHSNSLSIYNNPSIGNFDTMPLEIIDTISEYLPASSMISLKCTSNFFSSHYYNEFTNDNVKRIFIKELLVQYHKINILNAKLLSCEQAVIFNSQTAKFGLIALLIGIPLCICMLTLCMISNNSKSRIGYVSVFIVSFLFTSFGTIAALRDYCLLRNDIVERAIRPKKFTLTCWKASKIHNLMKDMFLQLTIQPNIITALTDCNIIESSESGDTRAFTYNKESLLSKRKKLIEALNSSIDKNNPKFACKRFYSYSIDLIYFGFTLKALILKLGEDQSIDWFRLKNTAYFKNNMRKRTRSERKTTSLKQVSYNIDPQPYNSTAPLIPKLNDIPMKTYGTYSGSYEF